MHALWYITATLNRPLGGESRLLEILSMAYLECLKVKNLQWGSKESIDLDHIPNQD